MFSKKVLVCLANNAVGHTPMARRESLGIIKHHPDRAKSALRANLRGLTTVVAFTTREIVAVKDEKEAADELFAFCLEYFKEELKSIP